MHIHKGKKRAALMPFLVITLAAVLGLAGPTWARRGVKHRNAPLACVGPRAQATSAADAGGARALSDFALRDGDRVLFYGDSITEQRLYTTYVEHYVLTHYPQRRVTFINTGWGGDKVTGNDCKDCVGVGGLARIERDVIDHRPTVVTLLFGMNDGLYRDFDPAVMKVYTEGLAAIIHELKTRTRARIYVMTPTVYDATRHTPWSHTNRYNEVLDRYSEAARQLAAREGLPVIDLHVATTTALRQAKELDPSYTFVPDGVHPEADGQLVMAAEILRAWGAPPAGVEMVQKTALDGDGTASFNLKASLPWPVPQPSEKLRKVRPEINAMGAVRLKLGGLPPGSYTLNVDGLDAGADYTAEQLGAGIDLGQLSREAQEATANLAALVRQRADFFFLRWRQIEVPYSGKYQKTAAAISSLDALIQEMTERARLMGQPHQYRLVVKRK